MLDVWDDVIIDWYFCFTRCQPNRFHLYVTFGGRRSFPDRWTFQRRHWNYGYASRGREFCLKAWFVSWWQVEVKIIWFRHQLAAMWFLSKFRTSMTKPIPVHFPFFSFSKRHNCRTLLRLVDREPFAQSRNLNYLIDLGKTVLLFTISHPNRLWRILNLNCEQLKSCFTSLIKLVSPLRLASFRFHSKANRSARARLMTYGLNWMDIFRILSMSFWIVDACILLICLNQSSPVKLFSLLTPLSRIRNDSGTFDVPLNRLPFDDCFEKEINFYSRVLLSTDDHFTG